MIFMTLSSGYILGQDSNDIEILEPEIIQIDSQVSVPVRVRQINTEPDFLDSLKTDSIAEELRQPFLFPFGDRVHIEDNGYTAFEKNENPMYKRGAFGEKWMVLLIVIVLILIASLKSFYTRFLQLKVASLYSQIEFREQLESYGSSSEVYNFLYQLIKILIISTAMYLVIISVDYRAVLGLLLFVYVLLSVSAFVILKLVFSRVFAVLMNMDVFEKKYILLQSGVDVIFLTILFPTTILLYYMDYFADHAEKVNLFILLSLTLYFVSRVLVSLIQNKDTLLANKFLLIVYLCTFEILPYLILVKLLNM